jgi:hypothetical protein
LGEEEVKKYKSVNLRFILQNGLFVALTARRGYFYSNSRTLKDTKIF